MPRKSRSQARSRRRTFRRKSRRRSRKTPKRRTSKRRSRRSRKSRKSSQRGYSLYTNRKGRKKVAGCGYKDRETAVYTIKLLKRRQVPLNRQIWTITALYYRAANHPYQTPGMRDAMRVYRVWLINHKGKC